MSNPLHVFTDQERENLYRNVKDIMRAKKITQLDIQLDIGVHFDSVRKIYKHRQHKCNMMTLNAIADYLKTTTEYLLTNKNYGN